METYKFAHSKKKQQRDIKQQEQKDRDHVLILAFWKNYLRFQWIFWNLQIANARLYNTGPYRRTYAVPHAMPLALFEDRPIRESGELRCSKIGRF